MKRFFLTAGSRLLSAVRLAVGAALLAPLPLLMVWYNYTVDCSGFFQGDAYLREVGNMVLEGKDIVGYEKMNDQQREILKIFVNNIDPVPDVIALGSSRIMQLSRDVLHIDSFFNCSVTGGDRADVMGTFYLFDREDRLPKTFIIGFDPWLLRSDIIDKRTDKELYAEFLEKCLGVPSDVEYVETDDEEKWLALYSPEYFQNNLSYASRDTTGVDKPQVVEGDVYQQTTEVKRGDGSLLYDVNYRNRSQEERDTDALFQCGNFLYMEDYDEVDQECVELFDKFFAYAQERGVNIVIMLTPYPPIVYDYCEENAEDYGGFLDTEPTIRELAAKYDIPVYGSYDPDKIEGVTKADFYDGLHCTAEAIEKIIWGEDGENEQFMHDLGY